MQRATNRVLSHCGVAGQLTATAEWSDNCGAVLIIKTNLSAGINACACHMRTRELGNLFWYTHPFLQEVLNEPLYRARKYR